MVLLGLINEWGGELFDLSTTPSLRATPPVPGGEFALPSPPLHSQFLRPRLQLHFRLGPDLSVIVGTLTSWVN